jgi:menaquinone-dependent protoporphyrinogen IX oxidase
MYFDVFISYSSKDKDIVKKIAEALSEEFQVFFDDYNVIVGDDIKKVITAGLNYSNVGLIIFSKNFFKNFNKSLKKNESAHFISKLVYDDKKLLPVWLDIDEKYMKKQIIRYNFNPRLMDIKAINISEKLPLSGQFNRIIAELNKKPKKSMAIRRTIKKDQLNAILLNLNDFLSDDWQKLTPQIVTDSVKIQIWEKYVNIKTKQTLDSLIHLFYTIPLAKKSFAENKKMYASQIPYERLFLPKMGEEQYGYHNGVTEVATFRTSNILATHWYYFSENPNTIKTAEKYSKIVDQNIKILLGKRE